MTRAQVIREMKKAERVEERRAFTRNRRGLASSQPKPFRGPVLARPPWFDEPDIKSKLVIR